MNHLFCGLPRATFQKLNGDRTNLSAFNLYFHLIKIRCNQVMHIRGLFPICLIIFFFGPITNWSSVAIFGRILETAAKFVQELFVSLDCKLSKIWLKCVPFPPRPWFVCCCGFLLEIWTELVHIPSTYQGWKTLM